MKWKKILAMVLAVTMLTGCGKKSVKANAPNPNVEQKNLFQLEEEGNMSVLITYESKKPDVAFIQPDGAVIMGNETPNNSGDGWLKFYLPNAIAGDWLI